MRYAHLEIEQLLLQTARLWRWLRFLRQSLNLATLATVLLLLFGVSMICGWITDAASLLALLGLLAAACLLAWLGIGGICAFGREDRSWLAGSLERVHAALLDRLNTLMFLEKEPSQRSHPYARQIEQQAGVLATQLPRRNPFSAARLLTPAGLLIVLLVATVAFYAYFRPWRYLLGQENSPSASPPAAAVVAAAEIPPVAEAPPQTPTQQPAWGEIRIVKPGDDVRAPLAEAISLEIEATANRPIREISWFTAINEGPETPHPLPPPADSRFAAYQPQLNLQSLGAQPGDVVRYYARAVLEDGKSYQSGLYFVDVAAPQDELRRVAGSPADAGSRALEELTAMIERQQSVLRQTQAAQGTEENQATQGARGNQGTQETQGARANQATQAGQLAEPSQAGQNQPQLTNQQQQAAAQQEADLARAAVHLRAELQSGFDPASVQQPTEQLAQAEAALGSASRSLASPQTASAVKQETAALGALGTARQQLQQFLSGNSTTPQSPDANQNQAEQAGQSAQAAKSAAQAGQSAPAAPPAGTAKQAAAAPQAAGQQAESKQPQSELQKQAPQNQNVARTQEDDSRLAAMLKKFSQMESLHQELEAVREAVQKSLGKQRDLERDTVSKDRGSLPQLALRQQQIRQAMEETTKSHASCLNGKCKKCCSAAGGAMGHAAGSILGGGANSWQAAAQAGRELQQLDDAVQSQQHDNRLAEAYQLKQVLDHEIEQLRQAQQPGGNASPQQLDRIAAHGKAIARRLKQIAEEEQVGGQFGEPLRQALQGAKQQALDQASDAVGQAADSGGKQQAAGKLQPKLEEISRAFDASRPGSLSPTSIGAAPQGMYGYNDRTPASPQKPPREVPQRPAPIDLHAVQKLAQGLPQRYSEKVSPKTSADEARNTHVDLSQLPPAYRASIERYFQKLSEQ